MFAQQNLARVHHFTSPMIVGKLYNMMTMAPLPEKWGNKDTCRVIMRVIFYDMKTAEGTL